MQSHLPQELNPSLKVCPSSASVTTRATRLRPLEPGDMHGEEVCERTRQELHERAIENLCAEVRIQEANFVRGQPSDDAAGLELFRRAMRDGDEAAWSAVIGLYRDLLLSQTRRRNVRGLVVEDAGFCVDRAFQRFWRATRSGQTHRFDDLASILKYLRMCLGSVLLDEARAQRRQAWVSIDDVLPETHLSSDPAALVIGRIGRRELWDAIDGELFDPDERLLAHLSFVGGLSPRQIQQRYADRFDDVQHVYRLKRNMIERLRRSRAIQDLLD